MTALIAAAFVAAMVFPLLAATIVAWFPGTQPERKVLFVFVSVVLASGLGSLIEIAFMIVTAIFSYFWPGWPSEGHLIFPLILEISDQYGIYFAWGAELLLGIAVPVILRRTYWTKLVAALS